MKKLVLIVIVLVYNFTSSNVFAQEKEKTEELEEVVITATKFKQKKEQVGKVIQKITQRDILNNAGSNVIELLNRVVGIEIKGVNTNVTEPRSIYVRGGRSRQVLILIDGVPVSDPSFINQEYDLRLISLNQIQSIEILKGASSSLYGSAAATAVINIILKKAKKDDFSLNFETSIGSNNNSNSTNSILSDINQNLSFSGNSGNFNFLTSLNYSGKVGLSSAKSITNQVYEDDVYEGTNGLLKLGYNFSESISITSFLNLDTFNYDYDAGIYEDSSINNGRQFQTRFGIRPTYKYSTGELFLLASLNKVKRTDVNFSTFSNTENVSIFEGESLNLDLVNKYNFTDKFQLITGINYQNHSNNSTTPFGNIDRDLANFNTIDPYASAIYNLKGFNINLGGRLNIHSNYGNHFVYDANVSKQLIKTDDMNFRTLASYSSAFIAPSTYQLFSAFGNTDLNPEISKTTEIGFTSNYKKWLRLNATYFNRVEDNAIIFTNLTVAPWGIYANATETIKVSGVETELTLKPLDKLKLNLGYTYTDKNTDVDYIPTHKFIANAEFYPTEKSLVSLVYKNVGDRFARYFDSSTFTTVETTLPKYDLLDVNANYKILDGTMVVFGSITNLLNTDYEDVLGYEIRGRNYRVGIRFNF